MKLPKSFYSWTTIWGALVASISFLLIVLTIIISFVFPAEGGNYLGLFTYIILPVFLVVGLVMIPVGMIRKMKRDERRAVQREVKFPIVNLNDPNQRRIIIIFVVSTAILLLFTSIGSYQAYHITESNKFCGLLCHKVMAPEYSTYHNSPHARVKCVECHVGTGASWYVKSKLSGLYQVYSVLTKSYPTPIATPIHNLRPARETCEECHWPQKFYGPQFVSLKHYLSDEENTEWNIQLLLKVGPQHSAQGQTEGIHWHINPNVKVEYTSNAKRDTVIEVKYTNLQTGEVRVYNDSLSHDVSISGEPQTRTMDCLDCHNRPSHNFLSPSQFIDAAISTGKISSDIPDIKSVTMGILVKEFPTTDSAMNYISARINKYYKKNYKELTDTGRVVLDSAIVAVQDGYRNNIFPLMKSQWNDYPNHIGHIESNGCFRCHNNSLKSKDGHIITNHCNLCHTIEAQGPTGNMEYAKADSSLAFNHPFEMTDWEETNYCTDCHSDLY